MAIRKYVMILVGAMLTRVTLGAPTPSSQGLAATTTRSPGFAATPSKSQSVAATTASSQVGGASIPTFSAADIASGKALKDLNKLAYDTAMARAAKAKTGCTKDKVKIRKEWRNMTMTDRRAYQEAVQCLMRLPSRYKDVDGAKSAWDDYGVLHYHQTPYVHDSATFLLWHRHYNWVLEKDLHEMCGYNGIFPYWEWGLDCADMLKSPVFDGSEYSLGGNGEPSGFGTATGGGCLKKGTPFANFTVNIGPMSAANPLKYNPRCIKRDLSSQICKSGASFQKTANAILISKDIKALQAVIQGEIVAGVKQKDVGMGVHSGGHYSIAGDPGSDTYFSPLEPGFYLHHGNIDRLHFIWQNLDWENRQTIWGSNFMGNSGPAAKLTDILVFEPLSKNLTIADPMDTVGGTPLCYIYEPW